MITLTTPIGLNTVLGGNQVVNYDKLVLAPFSMDAVAQTISGSVRLTSTAAPQKQPLTGSFRISVASSEIVIEIERVDFYSRIVLSGAQNTAVLAQIEAAQSQIETGLISLGVISGTRSSGA